MSTQQGVWTGVGCLTSVGSAVPLYLALLHAWLTAADPENLAHHQDRFGVFALIVLAMWATAGFSFIKQWRLRKPSDPTMPTDLRPTAERPKR